MHTAGIMIILILNWWLLRMHRGIGNSWNTNNVKSTFRVGLFLKCDFRRYQATWSPALFTFLSTFPELVQKKYILPQIKACLKYLILNINSENQITLKTENYSELSLKLLFSEVISYKPDFDSSDNLFKPSLTSSPISVSKKLRKLLIILKLSS